MIYTDAQARASAFCIGCLSLKQPTLLVCWNCFKYSCPTNPTPLKYSGLSFEDWQRGKTLSKKTDVQS